MGMQISYFTEQFFKKRCPKTFNARGKKYYENRQKYKNIIKKYEDKIWNKEFAKMDKESIKCLLDLLREMIWY